MSDIEENELEFGSGDGEYTLPEGAIYEKDLGFAYFRSDLVKSELIQPSRDRPQLFRRWEQSKPYWHGRGWFYNGVFEAWDMPDGKSFGLNYLMRQKSCCQRSNLGGVDVAVWVEFVSSYGTPLHRAFIGQTSRTCDDTPREWRDGLHRVDFLPYYDLIEKSPDMYFIWRHAERVGKCYDHCDLTPPWG